MEKRNPYSAVKCTEAYDKISYQPEMKGKNYWLTAPVLSTAAYITDSRLFNYPWLYYVGALITTTV